MVTLRYRLNPNNAYVAETAKAAFVGRHIQYVSRAAEDVAEILTPLSREVKNGELTVNAKVNKTALSTTNEKNIAAVQLWNGQDVTTSDYTYITSKDINVTLVDSAYMKANPNAGVKTFYKRTMAIVGNGETSAFIQQMCPLSAAANAELVYNSAEGLDLSKLPGFYCVSESEWLVKLGFKTMTYKFSLPTEYKSNDAQGTNQQWFVELTGENKDHLVVNRKNLTDGLTPAVGRTPVVRVDAFLEDNDGNTRMVASSYIKIDIVTAPTVAPEINDYVTTLGKTPEFEYHNLNGNWTAVNEMPWQDVNNAIYGKTGLTSQNFWNVYEQRYTVAVTALKNGAETNVFAPVTRPIGSTAQVVENNGIRIETLLGNGDTQTANIKFAIDNKIKTENTYDDVDGKGARYTVTITIKNRAGNKGDVIIKQVFYVKEDCKPYDFNPNFYAGTVNGRDNVVITKGKLAGGKWVLEMNISEVFQMINGQNIFAYFNTVNNAAAINFSLDPANQAGVNYTETFDANNKANQGTIKLTAALTEDYKFASMKYDVTLVNGEKCTFFFNVKFNNPFTNGTSARITLNGNATGLQTADVRPSVNVIENGGSNGAIYTWNATSKKLVLSSVAQNTYKVAEPTVKYEFVQDEAYKTFYGNLDIANGAQFKVNETTGVVTYDNLGATLIPSYNLTIKATVTFANLSEVTCMIPFTVKGQN